jgi:hypothetical protein
MVFIHQYIQQIRYILFKKNVQLMHELNETKILLRTKLYFFDKYSERNFIDQACYNKQCIHNTHNFLIKPSLPEQKSICVTTILQFFNSTSSL